MGPDYTTKYAVASQAATGGITGIKRLDWANAQMKQLFALAVRRRIHREERLVNAENVGIFVDQAVPKPLEVGNVGISAQLNGNIGAFAAETAAVTIALRHIARAGIVLVVVADALHFGIVNTVAALIADADILPLAVGRNNQLALADLNIILSGNAAVAAVNSLPPAAPPFAPVLPLPGSAGGTSQRLSSKSVA